MAFNAQKSLLLVFQSTSQALHKFCSRLMHEWKISHVRIIADLCSQEY